MEHALRRGAPAVAAAVALVLLYTAGPAAAVDLEEAAPLTAADHRHDDDGRRDWWDDDDDRDRGNGSWRDRGEDRGHGRGRGRSRDWDEDDDAAWNSLAGFAANNGGEGFWVLTKTGQVFAVEGAPDLGSITASRAELVAIAGHPSAEGFWVLDAEGGVTAFGAARDHGSAGFGAVGIAPHRTGEGYWIAAADGRVQAFGVAAHHGDARAEGLVIDRIVPRDDADGYYLAARNRWLVYPQPPPRRDHDRDGDHPGNGHAHGHDKHKHKHKPPKHRDGHEPSKSEGTTKPPRRPDRPKPPTDSVNQPPVTTDPNLATIQGITVDRQIAGRTRRLLRAAARAGMKLGGWGHRSHARQIELRRAHCGRTRYAIYEKPSSSCRPPTARPGSSMHEVGRAIDFFKRGANGQALPIAGTREFRWLKRNAARFGYYNLPSEPWHWSTNGR